MADRVDLIAVDGASIAVDTIGSGEPVVVIQTALTVDELGPLCRHLAGSGNHEVRHVHRRGYGDSGPARRPGSVAADAVDAAALIRAGQAGPAHVVGVSYSAAVGLSLAAAAPDLVQTLTVVEPPPSGTPGAAAFRQANKELLRSHEALGPGPALDRFMTALVGGDWRAISERDLPGSVAAMERDAAAFFESDVPALLSWRFDEAEAAHIRCPVLYVGGEQSSTWFTEMRSRLLRLLTGAHEATVEGAGHMVATSHTAEVARLVLGHLHRHPRPGEG